MSTEQTTPANGFSYKLTRTLDASAVKVWRAWTTPEQYARWAYAVLKLRRDGRTAGRSVEGHDGHARRRTVPADRLLS